MELEFECTLDVEVGPVLMLPEGPAGTRIIVPVNGGSVTGTRINGVVVGPGGDWLTVGPEGWGRIDVRLQIQTDDGALLCATYGGLLEMNERAVAAMLSGDDETDFDEQYFRTSLRLEAADARYEWVNRTVFVGQGRVTRAGVAYDVYRLT
ncbi:MAG TPA: DUF3237 domain-containing protein [Acidimicrobiales bacterium]|nr:DUF3237 domain-containing protein [Acidimicrobiales bacterium]